MIKKHECRLKVPNTNYRIIKKNRPTFTWCRRQWLSMVMVSANHPFCQSYFRSEVTLRQEKMRQLNSAHPWVIHPLSKFRMIYEIWLCFLYTWSIVQKPVDSAFGNSDFRYPTIGFVLGRVGVVCDFFCIVDIFVTCISGYIVQKNKVVELRLQKIWRHYLISPHFICDLLSSFPKMAINVTTWRTLNVYLRGTINLVLYLKIVRLTTLMKLTSNINKYFGKEPIVWSVLTELSILLALLVHYTGCLGWTLTKVVGRYYGLTPQNDSWIYHSDIGTASFFDRYTHSVFRSVSFLFCVQLQHIYVSESIIDRWYRKVLYVLGKIVYVYTVIILSTTIINSRRMEIKYYALINQVLEYTKVSECPDNLRDRILAYYRYKYQKKFFMDKMLTNLLTKSLIDEINMYSCATLLKNVKLLSYFSKKKQMEIVQLLKPEIYMPGDTIILYGTHAHALYFIDTGTVAVYTRSGKEVGHMEDGAYFGELSLLLKSHMQNTTVIAVETTQTYKLSGRRFLKFLQSEKKVFTKVVDRAMKRYKFILDSEDNYRKHLFETEYSGNIPHVTCN